MVWRSVVFCLMAFMILPGFLGGAPAEASLEDVPCPGVTEPGQDLSCPAEDGGWVRLLDGEWHYTHGPDPAPVGPEEEPPFALTEDAGPVCALPGSPRSVLIYSVPVDKTSRYDVMADRIRDLARQANARVAYEASQYGHDIDLRVECDPFGTMTVYEVRLATPGSTDSYATITTQIQAQGFTDPLAKYWIWHDNRIPGIGGQAMMPRSDAPTIMNGAIRGPHYAVTYGYESVRIMLHELAHTMGAVQLSAPNTTGNAHCIDGRDVMCYNDGGGRGNLFTNQVCRDREWFDCNHNDYFHPAPPAGTYLHDHWNLASHLNPFLEIRDRCPWVAGAVTGEETFGFPIPGLTEHWLEGLPASCAGRHFSLISPNAPDLTPDLVVCWYEGETELRCDERSHTTVRGTIPAGTDRGRVTLDGPGTAAFILNVN